MLVDGLQSTSASGSVSTPAVAATQRLKANRGYLLPLLWIPLLLVVLLFFVSGWFWDFRRADLLVADMVLLAFVIWQLHRSGYHITSAPVVYLAYLFMYHTVWAAAIWFIPGAEEAYQPWVIAWLNSPGAKMAVVLIPIAIIAFALGCSLSRPRSGIVMPAPIILKTRYYHMWLFWVGLSAMFAALALFFGTLVASGGLSLLFTDYLAFRELIASQTGFVVSVFLLGLGGVLAISGAPHSRWWWPLLPFIPMSAALLISGNRGEVFYSLLVFGVLIYRRGVRLPRPVVIASAATILAIIPIIAQVRSVGFGQSDRVEANSSIVLAASDLGSAARPLTTVANWSLNGAEYLGGGSYWLPFERILNNFLPFIPGDTEPELDPRFVAARVSLVTGSPMGYSTIAEAFQNFGFLGPVLIFILIGVILSRLHISATNSTRLAILGVVLLPLVNYVRNSFIFVPGQMIVGLGLVWLLSKLPGQHRRPGA